MKLDPISRIPLIRMTIVASVLSMTNACVIGKEIAGTDAQQNEVSAADAADHVTPPSDGMTDANSTLVAQCRAMALQLAANCTGPGGDADNECEWNGYADLCAVGNTQLILDSMTCLDQHVCQTAFTAAPAACLLAAHTAGETSAEHASLVSFCGRCGHSNCTDPHVGYDADVIPYLSDSDSASVMNCMGAACGGHDLFANCSALPGLEVFHACGM